MMKQPDYLSQAALAMTAAAKAVQDLIDAPPTGQPSIDEIRDWRERIQAARRKQQESVKAYSKAFRRWQQEIAHQILESAHIETLPERG